MQRWNIGIQKSHSPEAVVSLISILAFGPLHRLVVRKRRSYTSQTLGFSSYGRTERSMDVCSLKLFSKGRYVFLIFDVVTSFGAVLGAYCFAIYERFDV